MSATVSGLDTLVAFAIVSFIAAIAVTGAWGIQSFFLRSKAGKLVDAANRQNLTLAFFFQSNHQIKFMPARVHANGYLETLSKNKKEHKHFVPILRTTFTRPSTDVSSSTTEEGKAEAAELVKEAQEIAQVEQQILKPSHVEGTNCSSYLIYDGVALAVTPEALVALGVTHQNFNVKVGEAPTQIQLNVGLDVNPQLVKKYLTKLYDQSTVDGYGQDMYQAGWNDRGKQGDSMSKWAIILGLGLCILGAVMLVVSVLL